MKVLPRRSHNCYHFKYPFPVVTIGIMESKAQSYSHITVITSTRYSHITLITDGWIQKCLLTRARRLIGHICRLLTRYISSPGDPAP